MFLILVDPVIGLELIKNIKFEPFEKLFLTHLCSGYRPVRSSTFLRSAVALAPDFPACLKIHLKSIQNKITNLRSGEIWSQSHLTISFVNAFFSFYAWPFHSINNFSYVTTVKLNSKNGKLIKTKFAHVQCVKDTQPTSHF